MAKMEKNYQPTNSGEHTSLPGRLANPAKRALASAGITHLDQLCSFQEKEIQELHGIGPNALKELRTALDQAGLDYKRE